MTMKCQPVWGGLCSSSVAMVGLSDLSDLLAYKSTPILTFRGFFLHLFLFVLYF